MGNKYLIELIKIKMNRIIIVLLLLSASFAKAQNIETGDIDLKSDLSSFRDTIIDHLLFLDSINKVRIVALSETIRAQQSTIDNQKKIIEYRDKEVKDLKEKIMLFQDKLKRIGELIKNTY